MCEKDAATSGNEVVSVKWGTRVQYEWNFGRGEPGFRGSSLYNQLMHYMIGHSCSITESSTSTMAHMGDTVPM